MRFIFYRLRRVRGSVHSGTESVRVVARKDVQWNRPVFKAPSLPTPQGVGGDVLLATRFQKRKSRPR